MKKLVLIPHERYQQLISKESPPQNFESTAESVLEEVQEKQPPKEETKEKPKEVLAEVSDTPLDKDHLQIPPPPGEPNIPKQSGSGAELKRRIKRKSVWESKWSAY